MRISVSVKLWMIALLVPTYLFTAFSGNFSTPVQAQPEWSWTQITDQDFMNTNYAIYDVAADLDHDVLYLHGQDMNIYEYDGDSTFLIDDDLQLDGTYSFVSMTVWRGILYAGFTDGEAARIFKYDGDFVWSEVTNPYPQEGIINIPKLAVVNDELFEWVLQEGSTRYMNLFDGTDWTTIGAPGDFGEINISSCELVDVASSQSNIYVLLRVSESVYAVFRYDFLADGWVQLGSTLEGLYGDVEIHEGELYLASGDRYSGGGTAQVLKYDSGGNSWTNVLPEGLINPDNTIVNFVIYNYYLYATFSNPYGGDALLYLYRNDDWELVSSFIGTNDGDNANSLIYSLADFGRYLFIGVSQAGEGPYNSSGWLFGPASLTDFDGDGIPDNIEDSDIAVGNPFGAARADSHNPSVATFVNPITGLGESVLTSCFALDTVSVSAEPTGTAADRAFNYPLGMTSFNAYCSTSYALIGMFVETNEDISTMVLRKYNSSTHTYATLTDIQIESAGEYGGHQIYMIMYVVEDGGEFDADGTVNGVIVDPVGLAMPAVSVPDTAVGVD